MAEDDFKSESHLTENGWFSGTSWYFDKVQEKEVPRPDNAVETWLREERQHSRWSKSEITWTCTWQKPGIAPSVIQELHKKFPKKGLNPFPAGER